MTAYLGVDEFERIPEEDDDDYPCVDPEACGDWCWGFCYTDDYGSAAAYP